MLISLCASGYSRGQLSSFHCSLACGFFQGAGMNLFQALGEVPPTAPTAPVRALSSMSARVTCQPWRLPAAAARQMCDAKAVPAAAISCAICTTVAAGSPLSCSANSGVYCAYSLRSSRMKFANVGSLPGERWCR